MGLRSHDIIGRFDVRIVRADRAPTDMLSGVSVYVPSYVELVAEIG